MTTVSNVHVLTFDSWDGLPDDPPEIVGVYASLALATAAAHRLDNLSADIKWEEHHTPNSVAALIGTSANGQWTIEEFEVHA